MIVSIFMFFVLVMLTALLISLVSYYFIRPKNNVSLPELVPGDVIINKLYDDNPYIDITWKYETVVSVKKSDTNSYIYFKSYTSDINGEQCPNQSKYIDEHTCGKKYYSEDYKKVNHINLRENEKQEAFV